MPDYCSLLARAAHEPLIGTASRNDCHVVLAIPRKEWLGKVEDMEGIAGQLSALIAPLKDQVTLSLKHCTPAERGTLWLFPHGYRFEDLPPEQYPELIEQALNGQITLPHQHENGQVILLCTHGKRDAACAKFGGEVAQALREQLPENIQLWEVTHLGGHRFAGTAVVQPHQHWYGFLTPDDVPNLLAAIQGNYVLTSHYRGNAAYPPPLQLAELWGWEQLAAQEKYGEVYLFNPQLNGKTAHVEVGIAVEGKLTKTILQLAGEPYQFIADTDSPLLKDRLIWQVASVGASP